MQFVYSPTLAGKCFVNDDDDDDTDGNGNNVNNRRGNVYDKNASIEKRYILA